MDAKSEGEKKDLTILDLNEDCLIEICGYLTFDDLLQLFRVHKQFHGAIGGVLPVVCVNLHFDTQEEAEYIEKFLQVYGNHIKNLEFSLRCGGWKSEMTEKFIKNYCSNGIVSNCKLVEYFIRSDSPTFFMQNPDLFISLEKFTLGKSNAK